MRRRSIGAFLFSLALLVQILVPAAAAKMVGYSDDAALAAICASSGAPADHSAPDGLPARHDHCQICHSIGAAPVVPDASPSCVAATYGTARSKPWIVSPEPVALSGEDQHRPPRGPPALS